MKSHVIIVGSIVAALAFSSAYAVQNGEKGGKSQKPRVEQQKRISQDAAKGDAKRIEAQKRARKELKGEEAGAQRKAEVQARNKEQKQIKEEYKEARKSGEGEKVKGKKPWWKFWGS